MNSEVLDAQTIICDDQSKEHRCGKFEETHASGCTSTLGFLGDFGRIDASASVSSHNFAIVLHLSILVSTVTSGGVVMRSRHSAKMPHNMWLLLAAASVAFCLLSPVRTMATESLTTDDLPIQFTRVPSNLTHGSSHCQVATLIEHPVSPTRRTLKPFNPEPLPSKSGKFGTGYGGWLGDGETAVIYKASYRLEVDDMDCRGQGPDKLILEPFVVKVKTGSVIARPTLWEDDAPIVPTADYLSMSCWYYREALVVSPRSTKADGELWFHATRTQPASEPHCRHLGKSDSFLLGTKPNRYGHWSRTKFNYDIGTHGCTVAPNGKGWACEDHGLRVGPVAGVLGSAIQPPMGLAYAIWRPDSQGFVYMSYTPGAAIENTARLTYVPVSWNAEMQPMVGASRELAPKYPPSQICEGTINQGVKCKQYAGDGNRGNIGSDIPVWSRDSKWVYFSALVAQPGSSEYHRVLVRASPDSPQVEVLTDKWKREAGHPAVSPSGKYVAFLSTRTDDNKLTDVFLLDVLTHDVQRLTEIDGHFQAYNLIWWKPDADLYATRGH